MTSGIADLNFSVILPLLGGLLLTVLLTARMVNSLFERNYALMSRVILGVVIASTLMILTPAFDGAAALPLSAACFAGGFALVRWMDIYRTKQDSENA